MTGQPDPRTIFVDYRVSRRRWLVGLAVTGVLVGLLTVGYAVRTTVSSPAATLHAYFSALSERDVAAALAVVAPEVAGEEGRELLDDRVLRSPDYQPPGDLSLDEVTVEDRNAVAEVSFTIGDHEYRSSLRLRRDDGFTDRLVPRWLLVDAFGSVALGEVPDQVSVNGHQLSAYDADAARVLPAFPGGYQVGVPDGDPLWQERASPVQVPPEEVTEVDVAMVVRPELRAQVEQRVSALLDDCAAQGELLPTGCPFGYAVLESAQDVEWQITRYPAIALNPGQELGETVLTVETTREGEAVVSGERDLAGPFEATVEFPVGGFARVQGDSVLFTPDW